MYASAGKNKDVLKELKMRRTEAGQIIPHPMVIRMSRVLSIKGKEKISGSGVYESAFEPRETGRW